MLQKLSSFLTQRSRKSSKRNKKGVRIIPRDQHTISRSQISRGALDVLNRLHEANYQAFLVGGCLRDLLTGNSPKDFDIATDASPEEVHELFRRSRIIGRRFRIVHVRAGREIIEVTTFRGSADADATVSKDQHATSKSGLLLRDNVFGSIEEDAKRRDFTVNALYYNIADFALYDFTNSLDDIAAQRLRLIGDPTTRYREDPVRMLRAARFSAKLGFQLDDACEAPIYQLGQLLLQVSSARLFDEQLKLFLGGYAEACFYELERLGLFALLFPDAAPLLENSDNNDWRRMLIAALRNTDNRIAIGKRVTPAFLLAVLLWPVIENQANRQPLSNRQQTIASILTRQVKVIAIPKRFSHVMREIWELQPRLESRRRPAETAEHGRFRAAYDFLLLREEAGLLPNSTLGDWWTRYQEANPDQQHKLLQERPAGQQKRRRRRRRKPSSS